MRKNPDNLLILKMTILQQDMQSVASMLFANDYEGESEELQGAAEMMQTWIDGVHNDAEKGKHK